ncbi:hypothetical protein [Streptomyces uncialis]|uniref:hypothetical protein n=1 Tax=Streptomyces uncialis TaxID=1048205 RepID=UPI0033D502D2
MDTVLTAIGAAAVVYTVRGTFNRRRVLAEARRHRLETPRSPAFPPGLDDRIADQALARHSRQLTVPREGRRASDTRSEHLYSRLPLARPLVHPRNRRQTARSATRYERAKVASFALQSAIRDARTAPSGAACRRSYPGRSNPDRKALTSTVAPRDDGDRVTARPGQVSGHCQAPFGPARISAAMAR